MTDREFYALMARINLVLANANRAAAEAEAAIERAKDFMGQQLVRETEEFLREQA